MMYYDITNLCPRTDIDMGRHGFAIYLHPKWKALVAANDLDQKKVNTAIATMGKDWLEGCGYRADIYNPRDIRVSWGEWGPEHITVPGNACGLDLDHSPVGNPLCGPALLPHNIDSWHQKQLLLIVFCFFSETLAIQAWEKIRDGLV